MVRPPKVGQHVLGGKTHGNTADPAKGQHAGDAEAQGLQDNQGGNDDDREAAKLGQGIDGCAVDRVFHRLVAGEDIARGLADEPQQKPGQRDNDDRVAGGNDEIHHGRAEVAVHDLNGEVCAGDPQDQRQRFAGGLDQGVVPD